MENELTLYPWQRAAWQQIQRAREQQRLPHGMLLCGPQGVGKRRFAETLANTMLCAATPPDGLPCGHCKGCLLVQAGNHPDRVVIAPEEEGREILVRRIRDYVAKAGLVGQLGGHKVVLIEPAERMNNAAANSLLKTLEEPVSRTLILLLTAHPAALPATIRSRCQQLTLAAPSRAVGSAWLAEQGIGKERELLLGLAENAPLQALELHRQKVLEERQQRLEGFILLLEGQGDPLKLAEQWEKGDLHRLFDWMSGWVIDLLRVASGSSASVALTNPDQQPQWQRLVTGIDSRALFLLLDKIYQARPGLRGSLNSRLLLEELLLTVVQCRRSSSGDM